jgi:PAS domain-containing protein
MRDRNRDRAQVPVEGVSKRSIIRDYGMGGRTLHRTCQKAGNYFNTQAFEPKAPGLPKQGSGRSLECDRCDGMDLVAESGQKGAGRAKRGELTPVANRSRSREAAPEHRFQTLVQNSSDLIVVLNDKAELLYANPSVCEGSGGRSQVWASYKLRSASLG